MNNWWGISSDCDFDARSNLCLTPNLCCSSTTMRARLLNSIFFWKTVWVPIRISISPFNSFFSIFSLSFFFVFPKRSSIEIFLSLNQLTKFSKCCLARTSVGHIKTDCLLFWVHMFIAAAATMVFPEPTSPWMSLLIGFFSWKFIMISCTTFCWAFVG